MNTRALQQPLTAGALALGLQLTQQQLTQLLDYLDLLGKWGKVYNLTAVRDARHMLTLHLLDSLSLVGPLQRHIALRGLAGVRVLDVGAGAGLPGVVLAICCPELQLTCVDSVAKKAAFVTQVAAALQLARLRAVHSRVEQVAGTFDVVTARAFASLPDLIACSDHALAADGVWVAMKGKVPATELSTVPATVQVFHVEHLQVPELDAQRCLVWMQRMGASAPGSKLGAHF